MRWQERAVCRGQDPALFFSEQVGPQRDREAKELCAVCPVRAECLDYALVHRIKFGVWGGLSERQRRVVRRERRQAREEAS